MFYASSHDRHLARPKGRIALALLNFKLTIQHKEQLILIGMRVPRHPIAFAPHQHHELSIQFSDDLRREDI
jgi:hypothetical protein